MVGKKFVEILHVNKAIKIFSTDNIVAGLLIELLPLK